MKNEIMGLVWHRGQSEHMIIKTVDRYRRFMEKGEDAEKNEVGV